MSEKYQIRFVNGKICVNRPLDNDSDQNLHGKIERTGSQVEFVPESKCEYFDTVFSDLVKQISCIRLTKKNTTDIFGIFEELIETNIILFEHFLQIHDKKTADIVTAD